MKLKQLALFVSLALVSVFADAVEVEAKASSQGYFCFWIICEILPQSPNSLGIGIGDPP